MLGGHRPALVWAHVHARSFSHRYSLIQARRQNVQDIHDGVSLISSLVK